MLELLYSSAKTVNLGGAPFLSYIQAWEALLISDVSLGLNKVFLDGSQFRIGRYAPILGSRVGGRIWWGWGGVGAQNLYGVDDLTAQPDFGVLLNSSWPIPPGNCATGDYVDEQEGYFLHRAGYAEIYRLSDGLQLGTVDPGWGVVAVDGFAYAGPKRVLAYHGASGQVALIDYVLQTILSQSTVRPFALAAYDCLHNLVVTIEIDGRVRVYLTTPAPAALSAPVFDPSTVRCLQGHQVQVRLTGDHGEPCPGYVVDWSLEGSIGWLSSPQSQTNENGYASNYYFGPRSGSGTEMVQARVAL